MFYNTELKREKQELDCQDCSSYDKSEKRCKGYGKVCFLYDKITGTCLDPVTNLPFNPEKNNPTGD